MIKTARQFTGHNEGRTLQIGEAAEATGWDERGIDEGAFDGYR